MSAPIDFTSDERSAINKLDKLTKALSQTEREIKSMNNRILRGKALRDQLIARRDKYRTRIRSHLDLIDTAKNRLEIP